MSTPEGKVKDAIKASLKKIGAYQFWPVQTGLGAKTVDCLACVDGHFVAIEAKAPTKEPTPLQWATLTKVMEARGLSLVIDCVEKAKRLPSILHEHGIYFAPE